MLLDLVLKTALELVDLRLKVMLFSLVFCDHGLSFKNLHLFSVVVQCYLSGLIDRKKYGLRLELWSLFIDSVFSAVLGYFGQVQSPELLARLHHLELCLRDAAELHEASWSNHLLGRFCWLLSGC